MERVGEHPIPAGPLAVRWLGYQLPEFRAGAEAVAEVVLQNAGTATWRQRRELGVKLSYHWLDDRGNAIVWDGPRVDFGGPVAAGRRGRGRAAGARAAAAGPVPARVRPRRGASLLVRRGRLPRRSSWTPRCCRGSMSGASPSSSAAAPTSRRRLALARRRSRSSTRTPSRSRTSSPARSRRPTGRAGSSTRTRRASSRWAARSSRAERALRPWAPGGGRNPAFSASSAAPVAAARHRARRARGPAGLRPGRRARDLRRADQTSTATRSSTRVKTNAPSASEAAAATIT